MIAHRDTPYLRLAIRSVFTQTLTDFELVFINNGMALRPENLGEIGHDSRLRWVSLPENLGVPEGYNLAVGLSCGEFVALLDSDDIALPDRLYEQVKALRENPEISAVYSNARTIDDQGQDIGQQFTLLSERDHRIFITYDMPAANPTMMARRDILNKTYARECFRTAHDFDVLTRILDTGCSMALPMGLVEYRRHAGQISNEQRNSQILAACIIRLVSARRRIGGAERLDELLAELESWMKSSPDPAVSYSFFARRCLNEGFVDLAVYHARKIISASRRPKKIIKSVDVLGRAMFREPKRSLWLLRLYLTGPVRAHHLKPA